MKKSLIIFLVFFVLASVSFLLFASRTKAPDKKEIVQDENITVSQDNPVPVEKSTTFVFAGDMMFDRYVNHIFKNVGSDHIFDNLDKTLFTGKDIAFANLEGPVSSDPIADDYPERSLVFNMPPETISAIKNLGLNGVSLANNHTLNASAAGFATTQSLLKNARIKYGGSQNGFDDGSVIRYETEIPISVIAVDFLSFTNASKISETIKTEKDAGRFVIVFPHWGTEYDLVHSTSQKNAAEKWIDAGADLIIGSHPHVVQDIDIYNNKPIIYSVGNFVFDQTFSSDTQQGLIISGKITETNLELTLHPIESIKLKPQLASESTKKEMLNRILNPEKISVKFTNSDTINLKR